MNRPYLIGISGGSCSGKTSVALGLARCLDDLRPVVVPLDSYYFDLEHVPEEERATYNFDHPGAIDFEMFENHLVKLLEGKDVLVPVYDYESHTRTPQSEWIPVNPSREEGQRVMIVEGLHVFYSPAVRELLDLKIFVDVGKAISLNRRVERDVRERGRTPESVVQQFQRHVVPMYEEYVEPVKEFSDLVVQGERPLEESLRAILALVYPQE
jgi:uridine kinase